LKTIKCRTKRDETRTLFLRFQGRLLKEDKRRYKGSAILYKKLQRAREAAIEQRPIKRWVGGQDRGVRAGRGLRAKTGNTVECIQSVLKE
jgi:hypothetical protein